MLHKLRVPTYKIQRLFISKKSFTLVELLIVIGIIAILSAVVVVAINPVEYNRQGRDAQRISDIRDLNTLISKYKFSGKRISSIGSAQTIYVSLLDEGSSSCANLGLPALTGGWEYHCATSQDDMKKTDGTGWLPVDLADVDAVVLPLDPSNVVLGSAYYAYVTDGSDFELQTIMESERYGANGAEDLLTTDGGDQSDRYETGSDLTLFPTS